MREFRVKSSSLPWLQHQIQRSELSVTGFLSPPPPLRLLQLSWEEEEEEEPPLLTYWHKEKGGNIAQHTYRV